MVTLATFPPEFLLPQGEWLQCLQAPLLLFYVPEVQPLSLWVTFSNRAQFVPTPSLSDREGTTVTGHCQLAGRKDCRGL